MSAGLATHDAIYSYAALTDPDHIALNQPIISAMSALSLLYSRFKAQCIWEEYVGDQQNSFYCALKLAAAEHDDK